jgi:TP901 family phage tail tape measure protein
MTDYNIRIIVDTSQADAATAKVNAGLESVDTQAAGSTKAMDTLIAEFNKAAAAASQFSAATTAGMSELRTVVNATTASVSQLNDAAFMAMASLNGIGGAAMRADASMAAANASMAATGRAAYTAGMAIIGAGDAHTRMGRAAQQAGIQSQTASGSMISGMSALGAANAANVMATERMVAGMSRFGGVVQSTGAQVSVFTGLIAGMNTQLVRTAEHLAAFAVVMTPVLGIASIAEFDQQLHTLQGISGATAKQMEMLKAKAIEVAQSGKFMTQQIAEGMVNLAKSGMNVEQIMKTVSTTMNFAQAHAIDPHEAANILTQGMHSARLTIDDFEHVSDVFTKVAKTSTSTVEQMMTAFKYAAPIMTGFGYDINTIGAAVAVLSANGIDASMAGTTLRNVFMRLAAPTKEFKDDLKDAGIELSNVKPGVNGFFEILDRLKKANLSEADLFKLFKQRGGTGIDVLLSRVDAMKEYKREIDNGAGATKRLTEAQDQGLVNSFLKVVASLTTFVAELGYATGFTRALITFLNALHFTFNALAQAIHFIGPAIQAMAIAFTLLRVDAIAVGFMALAGYIMTAARAMLVFLTTLGPIGWIVAAIGLITAAFQAWNGELYKIAGGAVTFGDLWQAVMNRIYGMASWLANGFTAAWNAISQGASAVANAIMAAFQTAIDYIIGALQKLANAASSIINFVGRNTGLGEMGKIDLGKVELPKLQMPTIANNLLGEAESIAADRIKKENDAMAEQKRLADSLAQGLDKPRSQIDKIGDSADKATKKHKGLKDAFDMLFGSAEKGAKHIAELKEMLAAGMITEGQFADGIQRAREELWKMDQTPMGGILKGLNEVAAGATRTGDEIAKVVKGAFGHMTDAIVEFAKTGKMDFKKLIDSILEDLLRLALNRMWGQLANGLLGTAGMGGASLFGFAGGGSFTVGGQGGTDSQIVAFKATPGERVKVETPDQRGASNGNGSPSVHVAAPQVGVKIVNSLDPHTALDALSSGAGEKVILNMVQRNPNAFRRILGVSS